MAQTASPESTLPASALTPRSVFLGTLAVVGTALAFLLVYVFANVLLLLFIGIILATAIRPLIGWLQARGLSKSVATLCIYLALLIAIAGLLSWFVPLVVEQVQALAAQLPENYSQLREAMRNSPSLLLQRLAYRLPGGQAAQADESQSQEVVEQVATAWNYGNWAIIVLLALAAILLIAYFWSQQEDRILRTLQLMLPVQRREAFMNFVATAQTKMGAYVRGQALLCVIIGVMNFIALWIIGIPYATTFAVLAGLLEALPIIGPILAAIAPAAVALSTDPSKVVWVLLASLLIQQSENYLLIPRIMQNAVGVNPIVTLLSLAAFATLMGFPGAVLAIPLAALVQLVLDRFLLDVEALEPKPPERRDAASVAHYHARDLIHDVRVYVRNKEESTSERNDALEEAIESIALDVDRLLSEEFGPVDEEEALLEKPL